MILCLVELRDNQPKKSSLESLCFAHEMGKFLNDQVLAICIGPEDLNSDLGSYGADEALVIKTPTVPEFEQIVNILSEESNKYNSKFIVLSLNSTGKNVSSVLAARLKKGLVSGVIDLKDCNGKIGFKKNVYSGKASAWYTCNDTGAVIATMPNGIALQVGSGKNCVVKSQTMELPESRVKTTEIKRVSGKTPLTEASVVVSAGRGMKDPSNWGMIEELAELLEATTACSRPVADVGWRPHHEHVGQTGIAIRPNVYIAIGISGAIQHLAGVNNSRKIIVINKDPEAPFFKAADYGICGDLFEVVPKLNEAIKKYKSQV